jgi:4-hydroxymandelate oxidase
VDKLNKKNLARRQLIQFLAARPLLAGLDPGRLLADTLLNPVSSPKDALDVFDFQRVAERVLPTAHYGYVATGTDGDETLHANRKAFEKLYLRALRMVDTSSIDTRLDLLGQKLSSPIVIAPVGSQKALHPKTQLAPCNTA